MRRHPTRCLPAAACPAFAVVLSGFCRCVESGRCSSVHPISACASAFQLLTGLSYSSLPPAVRVVHDDEDDAASRRVQFHFGLTPWYNCCTARRSSMSERIAPGNLQSVECAGLRYRNGGVAIVTRLRIVWRLLAEFTQLPLQSLCMQ